MGADGYTQGGATRLSAKVPSRVKDEFKQACEYRDVTMTEAIREFMEEYAAENAPIATVGDSDGGHYPSDSAQRELYEVCLDVAVDGGSGPTIYQRRHAGQIAQQTQQVRKSELKSALMPLRQRGYVALGPMPPTLQGESAKRWRSWIIKPPAADPEQWKFREGQ
jgi:hypothetical protein